MNLLDNGKRRPPVSLHDTGAAETRCIVSAAGARVMCSAAGGQTHVSESQARLHQHILSYIQSQSTPSHNIFR